MDLIMRGVSRMTAPGVHLVFDPTLVRGMSYYTGTIFEITIDGYNFSIAGGGRYDDMIGRFLGQGAPACGFSIGFERIITILSEHLPESAFSAGGKTAILAEKGLPDEKLTALFARAAQLRAGGKTSLSRYSFQIVL